MRCRVPLLSAAALLLALAGGCRREAPSAPPAAPATPADTTVRAEAAPALPAPSPGGAPFVFDTSETPEAPEAAVPIAPLPPPPPPEPPPTAPAPSGPAGACDVREAEQFCFTYSGTGWTPRTAREHCAGAPTGSFRAEPCPTEGRIATCTFRRADAPAREIVYTYYAPYDRALAQLACPGEFTAY
ncbi:MAG: hypothetical protein ACK41D_05780 [Rubricoccaceae bacterium]